MRQAITQLKLEPSDGQIPNCDHDTTLEDDDLTDGSPDDIWDIFDEEKDKGFHSSDTSENDDISANEVNGDIKYDFAWLKKKCLTLTVQNNAGLEAGELQERIMALLSSKRGSRYEVDVII